MEYKNYFEMHPVYQHVAIEMNKKNKPKINKIVIGNAGHLRFIAFYRDGKVSSCHYRPCICILPSTWREKMRRMGMKIEVSSTLGVMADIYTR
jgi:hypothetical protein